MNNENIIKSFNMGYSVKKITKDYYKYINRDCEEPHFVNGFLLVSKKNKTLEECAKYVSNVILEYIKTGEIPETKEEVEKAKKSNKLR